MAKEFFHYSATAKLFLLLEEASQRSGVSRGQAFEDFLTMSVCALSGGQMEELYLQTVAKHTAGKPGKRGCDSIARMFGELVAAMEQDTHEQMKDVLGDLFEGSISYGEHSQYMTPMPVCELMARLTMHEAPVATADDPSADNTVAETPDAAPPADVDPITPDRVRRKIHDPCCGSGRMLLAAAQVDRDCEFSGQDVDLRCVRMTALNLAFRNLYGYVIHGNTLAVEQKLVYRTGFDGRGFLREVPLSACPIPVQQVVQEARSSPSPEDTDSTTDNASSMPDSKLRLF